MNMNNYYQSHPNFNSFTPDFQFGPSLNSDPRTMQQMPIHQQLPQHMQVPSSSHMQAPQQAPQEGKRKFTEAQASIDDLEGDEEDNEEEEEGDKRKKRVRDKESVTPLAVLSFTRRFLEGTADWDSLVVEYPSIPADPTLADEWHKSSSFLSVLTIRGIVSSIVRKCKTPVFEKRNLIQHNFLPKRLSRNVCNSGSKEEMLSFLNI